MVENCLLYTSFPPKKLRFSHPAMSVLTILTIIITMKIVVVMMMMMMMMIIIIIFFFFSRRYTTHNGFVFYSPLSGFSLLAYKVTSSKTTTPHSR